MRIITNEVIKIGINENLTQKSPEKFAPFKHTFGSVLFHLHSTHMALGFSQPLYLLLF